MSRVVIWTIVGIVVVLGVIFIVTTRRQARDMVAIKPLSDEAYTSYVNRMERQIDIFHKRIDKVKTKYPSPSTDIRAMLDQLDIEMAGFENEVQNLKGKNTTAERDEAYNATHERVKKIRKLIRDLGGTTTAND